MKENTYLDYTYSIIDTIKESDDYKKLIFLQDLILSKYSDIYQDYIKAKKEFLEYKKNYGIIDPILSQNYQDIKIKYYNINEVIEYMALYKKINQLIFTIMERVTSCINENIKMRGF
jgi:cell fate (sporulation/competence/biofilm development) regulator YlbF (YheA/YmcA/DUF963 family)